MSAMRQEGTAEKEAEKRSRKRGSDADADEDKEDLSREWVIENFQL